MILQELDKGELRQKYEREVSKGRVDENLTLSEFLTKHYGLSYRYRANETETNSFMGAEACKQAMKAAKVSTSDIEYLIYAAASMDELIRFL